MSLALMGCPREPPPASWLEPSSPSSSPKLTSQTTARTPAGPFVSCEQTPVNELIRVDQFGYRPDAKKVAVLSDPIEGWNAGESLVPGPTYELRSWTTGQIAFSGAPKAWNQGALEKTSGDKGFLLDFSSVTQEDSYCLVDRDGGFRSNRFEIKRAVYKDVLRAAFKVFYFQRANIAKVEPYACAGGKCWTATAAYVGPGQDKEARSVKDRGNAATARDLSGGWWDAGDVNKYVTFAANPVHQLLTAYTDRPATFGDDFGIPESGNGLPDVVDELKVELDWLMKMQPADLNGGVLPKLGNVDLGDPAPFRSRFPRYYYPTPCSSATIAAAGVFAHAALVMKAFPALGTYAGELKTRAVRAYTHFKDHPRTPECDDGTIKAGDSDQALPQQEQSSVVAAIYLFALTGEAPYAEAIAKGYAGTLPMQDERWSSYEPLQGDALLAYAALPSADPAIKNAIVSRKLQLGRSVDIYGYKPELDLYQAFMRGDSYHWGHNMVRANVGNTNYDLALFSQLSAAERKPFSDRAEGILHWFHGVNPLGLVYLTNMYAYGAERSVNQTYHVWFRDGDADYDDAKKSRLGPPPGYIPGGPNSQYCAGQDPNQTACANSRLRKQPPEKAYFDFNTGWDPKVEHDRSWEVTEPAIYYQSAYVKLVSKFVD
jgi:endoglucanase